jgi:hypothetical protein
MLTKVRLVWGCACPVSLRLFGWRGFCWGLFIVMGLRRCALFSWLIRGRWFFIIAIGQFIAFGWSVVPLFRDRVSLLSNRVIAFVGALSWLRVILYRAVRSLACLDLYTARSAGTVIVPTLGISNTL